MTIVKYSQSPKAETMRDVFVFFVQLFILAAAHF